MSSTAAPPGSGNALHRRGDWAVSGDQFERLVPGTRTVEQGSNDRRDIGARDRATGHWRGREANPAGGGSVGEASWAQALNQASGLAPEPGRRLTSQRRRGLGRFVLRGVIYE